MQLPRMQPNMHSPSTDVVRRVLYLKHVYAKKENC